MNQGKRGPEGKKQNMGTSKLLCLLLVMFFSIKESSRKSNLFCMYFSVDED